MMEASLPLQPRRREDGSILIMTLIFLGVIGLLTAALTSSAFVVTKQSFSTTKIQARETGANAGLEWAVNVLRQGKDGFCLPGYVEKILTFANRQVRVTCKGLTSSTAGTNSFAVYINSVPGSPANSNFLGTQAATNFPKSIIGPVFNGGTDGTLGWDLNADLTIDGNVFTPVSVACPAGSTGPVPPRLILLYNTVTCGAVPLTEVTPAPIPGPCDPSPISSCKDPLPVLLDAAGVVTTGTPSCKVFSPGYYSAPPAFASNNFLKAGTYYFEFNKIMTLGSAVRGGDPAPGTSTSSGDTVLSSVPRCAPLGSFPVDSAKGYGVTFVFGKGAGLRVTNLGRIELFTNKTLTTQFPNIVTAGFGVTPWSGGPSSKSTVALNKDLIQVGTAQPEFVMHSGAFVPESGISLKGSNDAIEMFRGTVVAGRLEFQSSASITGSNFGVIVPAGGEKKYALMANSCPGVASGVSATACTAPPGGTLEPELCSVASLVIYDDSARTVWLDNWRIDRDASGLDLTTCAL
jgi:hypothetical protein